MATSFTQVPPDSTGDKLFMRERIRGSDTVLEQAVFVGEAPTYSAWANDIAPAASKSMLALFNAAASGVVVKIHDVRYFNLQTAAVTGVVLRWDIYKASAASAGTTITPEKWDSGAAALPAGVTVRTGGTVTDGSKLAGIAVSSEEHTTALAQGLAAAGISLFPAGLLKTNPLTLREGEGFNVRNVTSSTVGTFGFLIVFSVESTHTAD